MATTGERIKAYRELLGLTRRELAEKLAISVSAISNYENEHRQPDLMTLKRMAIVYDVAFTELIGDDPIDSGANPNPEAAVLPPPRRSPYEILREQEMMRTYQALNTDNQDIMIGYAKQLLKEQHGDNPPAKTAGAPNNIKGK